MAKEAILHRIDRWLGNLGSREEGRKDKEEKKGESSETKICSMAYTRAWQIARAKRNQVLSRLALEDRDCREASLPYDREAHLSEICFLLKELLADITGIESQKISVCCAFQDLSQYSVTKERWSWIFDEEKEHGREEISWMQEAAYRQGTLFYQTLHGSAPYKFVMDKSRTDQKIEYYPDQREFKYDNAGSAVYTKVNLEENGKRYMAGILMITTYEKSFLEADRECQEFGKTFEQVLEYSVLPYFRQLIQTEMGLLCVENRKQSMERR